MDYTKFEVDHSLINSNFLCYKLNSDKLLKKSIYLKNRPIQVDQNYNFFSKQHLQQFADGTNRFFYFKKNFGKENVFCYFDANLNIIEITQTAEGVFTETEYFTDLKDFKSNPEYYPYIELVSNNSDNYIVALGETLFYLSREKNENRFKALSCCKFEESISVLCVKIHVEGLNCVSIFVCQVLHKSLFQEVPSGGSNYLTQIDHVLLQDSILTKMETIYSIHYPKFLSYSPKHDICLVVASSGVHFNIEDLLKEFPKSKDLINSNLNYTFSENLSQVKIDIKIENIPYDSANVVISQNNLKVFVHYTTNIDSLSGCLFENVDCDGSNWSVKDN
ncbi:hypothetical protein A3Q56_06802 [Intoshia linei]|uniref:CS domain-containing protein n=1 Tax=Intoshia linei TaxID=1819745 RepID=A0A177AVG7_9BILA|nr:hypothetical protein A3Q56_06802 [Intoshia linei]